MNVVTIVILLHIDDRLLHFVNDIFSTTVSVLIASRPSFAAFRPPGPPPTPPTHYTYFSWNLISTTGWAAPLSMSAATSCPWGASTPKVEVAIIFINWVCSKTWIFSALLWFLVFTEFLDHMKFVHNTKNYWWRCEKENGRHFLQRIRPILKNWGVKCESHLWEVSLPFQQTGSLAILDEAKDIKR